MKTKIEAERAIQNAVKVVSKDRASIIRQINLLLRLMEVGKLNMLLHLIRRYAAR